MKNVIKQLRETAKKLNEQADRLEAGVDVKIGVSKCIHGEYTDRKFNGCKTCGNTVKVKCKFKKVGFVNSGGCNPAKCDKFETEKLTKM